MKKSAFTTKDAGVGLDTTPRYLQLITDEGLVIPEIANMFGRGTSRLYSRKNLVEFLIVLELRKFKFPINQIGRIMASARKSGADKKWDPEGKWGHIGLNRKAKLVICNPLSDEPHVEVHGGDLRNFDWDSHPSALAINIEQFFALVDEL